MPVDFNREVICLLGLPFDVVDMPMAVARIRSAARGGAPCFLTTPNLNFLIACQNDPYFRASVIDSDLSIADGMPLIWIGRLLGLPIRERIAGSSLFDELCRDTDQPLSVYFFGGPPGVAGLACAQLNCTAKGMRCVGAESPGYGSTEDISSTDTLNRINTSGADFVIVALGARKGQEWIVRNRKHISAPVISHLGAVVNFVAGTIRRAPSWMQNAGLEWLWRIKEEPSLWHRYFRDGLELMRLMTTRVLPYAWYLWQHRHLSDYEPEAILEARHRQGTTILRLSGSWREGRLDPLRREFASAAEAGADVLLEMGDVSYIDSAFVGLVLLLSGWQSQVRKQLSIASASLATQRVFHYSCAEFVLGQNPTLASEHVTTNRQLTPTHRN